MIQVASRLKVKPESVVTKIFFFFLIMLFTQQIQWSKNKSSIHEGGSRSGQKEHIGVVKNNCPSTGDTSKVLIHH